MSSICGPETHSFVEKLDCSFVADRYELLSPSESHLLTGLC